MNIQFWIDNADSLIHQIFMILMGFLAYIASFLGTTYNVVNIFVYYLIVPASWIYLISKKTTVWLNVLSIIGSIAFFIIPDLRKNCDYLFQKSVDFLNWLAIIFSSNYINMSIYICVLGISIVYLILIPLTLPLKTAKRVGVIIAIFFSLYLLFIYPNFKEMFILIFQKKDIKY
ncbi:hypothetical protein [Polaribacter sp. IC073]|uniref:hypothetical protein n=1 Tax=Polaribacter sp. IC073 TaxID=2508540 RepID=UPI0011BE7B3C|nr:hypothetical protein [Polaribacter sp. IC073]TXD48681.1 hypothetical protein ES045_05495 [Polaribacter sp. IC073]